MPRVQRGDRRRRVRVPGGQPDGRQLRLVLRGLCAECEETSHSAHTTCEACAFWHRATPSNTAHEAHTVWFVIFVVLVGLVLIVATIVVISVVVLVDRVMRTVGVAKQRETTCNEMSWSDLTFQSARHRGTST